MGATTEISWTDSTFNPWIGCQHVSPGCDHCYAETMMDRRYGRAKWGPHGQRQRTSASYWKNPLHWNANGPRFLHEHGHRHRVFCASLADVFDNKAPRAWRAELFELIRQTRNLDWLLLTKRPQNIRKFLPADWACGYPNVWLGCTAEDAQHYRQRWPILAGIPAAVRFVSYEPAIAPLGPVDLGIGVVPDWIITGGESGPGARPMKPDWARAAIADCERLNIAPFHKQWGTYDSNPLVGERGLSKREAAAIDNQGKGGGLVDGRVVRRFPTPRSSRSIDLRRPAA
jgi:protein gp37